MHKDSVQATSNRVARSHLWDRPIKGPTSFESTTSQKGPRIDSLTWRRETEQKRRRKVRQVDTSTCSRCAMKKTGHKSTKIGRKTFNRNNSLMNGHKTKRKVQKMKMRVLFWFRTKEMLMKRSKSATLMCPSLTFLRFSRKVFGKICLIASAMVSKRSKRQMNESMATKSSMNVRIMNLTMECFNFESLTKTVAR